MTRSRWKSIAGVRVLRTTRAASFQDVSVPFMREWRGRTDQDPGSKGPAFIRVGKGLVLYEIDELERWLAAHRASSLSVPLNRAPK